MQWQEQLPNGKEIGRGTAGTDTSAREIFQAWRVVCIVRMFRKNRNRDVSHRWIGSLLAHKKAEPSLILVALLTAAIHGPQGFPYDPRTVVPAVGSRCSIFRFAEAAEPVDQSIPPGPPYCRRTKGFGFFDNFLRILRSRPLPARVNASRHNNDPVPMVPTAIGIKVAQQSNL
jgi:hypothetical protein